jgi:hypothetical protein
VVNGPDLLVYCLDFERRCVVYTDNGQALRSPGPPFLYLEQRRVANRLAELPFEQLLRAAGIDAISEPDSYTNLASRRSITHVGVPSERELVQA